MPQPSLSTTSKPSTMLIPSTLYNCSKRGANLFLLWPQGSTLCQTPHYDWGPWCVCVCVCVSFSQPLPNGETRPNPQPTLCTLSATTITTTSTFTTTTTSTFSALVASFASLLFSCSSHVALIRAFSLRYRRVPMFQNTLPLCAEKQEVFPETRRRLYQERGEAG